MPMNAYPAPALRQPLRLPLLHAHPAGVACALAGAANLQHGAAILARGGPLQRAARLVDDGVDLLEACAIASKQGKGHIGELALSTHYTASAGVFARPLRARPSRRANDPSVDVEVIRRRREHGAQVKVGTPAHVRRAVRSGRYPNLIANREAYDALAPDAQALVHTRLSHGQVSSATLYGERCDATCHDVLVRALSGTQALPLVDRLVLAARAGMHDGLTGFALRVIGGLLTRMVRREAFDFTIDVAAALNSGARAAARTCLETALLLERFAQKAKAAFSARLLQRVARSRLAVSVIAEVVVETAVDLFDVLRGKLPFEELLRRFGVHVVTAAGAAAGVALARSLSSDLPPIAAALAMIVGGYVGGVAGRHLGAAMFTANTAVTP